MHHACTFCHLEGTNFAQPRYDMIQYKHKWRGVLPNKIADQSSYHFCNFSWKFQPQRENNAVNCGHYFYLAGLLLGKHKHSASSQKLNQGGVGRNLFLIGILLFLWIRSPCKVSEPYLPSFWYKSKDLRGRKRNNAKYYGHYVYAYCLQPKGMHSARTKSVRLLCTHFLTKIFPKLFCEDW